MATAADPGADADGPVRTAPEPRQHSRAWTVANAVPAGLRRPTRERRRSGGHRPFPRPFVDSDRSAARAYRISRQNSKTMNYALITPAIENHIEAQIRAAFRCRPDAGAVGPQAPSAAR